MTLSATGIKCTYAVDYLPSGGGSARNRAATGIKCTYAVDYLPDARLRCP